jgi:hypothetical protein
MAIGWQWPAGPRHQPGPQPSATSVTAGPLSTGGAIIAACADTAIPSASAAPRIDLANMPPSLDSPTDPSAAMADLTLRLANLQSTDRLVGQQFSFWRISMRA